MLAPEKMGYEILLNTDRKLRDVGQNWIGTSLEKSILHKSGFCSHSTTVAMLIFLIVVTGGCQVQPIKGATGIGDLYYPGLGNGGYDVQSYSISLDIDPLANNIRGSTIITALAIERLATFNLDFQGLIVDAVTVDEKNATFTQNDPEITITPSSPLDEQHIFSVTVTYHGSPHPIKSAASLLMVGWQHAPDGVINVFNEPDGASTWFPNNNHPRDKATFTFDITVPQPWMVVANGILKQTKNTSQKTEFIWEMDKPMASYLATINIDKYSVVTLQGPNGVPIHNYFPPGYPETSRKNFEQIPEMMKYLNGLFGNYPFSEYGVVIADSGSPICAGMGQALETQTLSLHCPNSRMAEENVIIHELAHQWFGDYVSLKNWNEIWLKEGMAFYTEWLWIHKDKELKALKQFVKTKSALYIPTAIIGQPPKDDLYNLAVYKGGALVFHTLRLKVGEVAYSKILHTYLERYSFGNAGTDDFINLAEQISGLKLKASFDIWLNTIVNPSLNP